MPYAWYIDKLFIVHTMHLHVFTKTERGHMIYRFLQHITTCIHKLQVIEKLPMSKDTKNSSISINVHNYFHRF